MACTIKRSQIFHDLFKSATIDHPQLSLPHIYYQYKEKLFGPRPKFTFISPQTPSLSSASVSYQNLCPHQQMRSLWLAMGTHYTSLEKPVLVLWLIRSVHTSSQSSGPLTLYLIKSGVYRLIEAPVKVYRWPIDGYILLKRSRFLPNFRTGDQW